MAESLLGGLKNRVLQLLAFHAPGAMSVRVWLHRWRGVNIGQDVFIGMEAIIETSYPWLVRIGNRVNIGLRTVIIAHFHDPPELLMKSKRPPPTVVIEDDVYIGPAVIVLPRVRIGSGAVICAGSVVTKNVPPLTLMRGNPAEPIARCGIPLHFLSANIDEFYMKLRPLEHPLKSPDREADSHGT
jgi:acetyltransferase-like isoleucine patch superfamily enzyme